MDNLVIRVLLPASEVPSGSVVTKRSGEKEYTLRDEIRIYGLPPPAGPAKCQVIQAEAGTRFLVGQEGNTNTIENTTCVLWAASPHDLFRYLGGSDEGGHP